MHGDEEKIRQVPNRGSGLYCPYLEKEVSYDYCISCADDWTVLNCHLPSEFSRAFRDFKSGRGDEIHATDLTGCIRRSWFQKMIPTPDAPAELMAPTLGTMIHNELEQMIIRPESWAEAGLSAITEDGVPIVGRVDKYTPGRGLVEDWKTTRSINTDVLPRDSHVRQLNVYAWLLRQNGQSPSMGRIQYISMSGPTKCRVCSGEIGWEDRKCTRCGKINKSVCPMGLYRTDVTLWTEEEADRFVRRNSLSLHQSMIDGTPPSDKEVNLCSFCHHEERCKLWDRLGWYEASIADWPPNLRKTAIDAISMARRNICSHDPNILADQTAKTLELLGRMSGEKLNEP